MKSDFEEIGGDVITLQIRDNSLSTRAAIKSSLGEGTSISVDAYQGNTLRFSDAITYSDNRWPMSIRRYWKDYGNHLDFCFTYPIQDVNNKSFEYTVGSTYNSQEDLLVNYVSSDATPVAIPVAMNHALSMLSFDVKRENVAGDPYTYNIEKVYISSDAKFFDNGRYVFNEGWEHNSKNTWIYENNLISNALTTEYNHTNGSDYLMIMPQTMDSLVVAVVYKGTYNGKSIIKNSGKVLYNVTYEEGKVYNYKITVPSYHGTNPEIIEGGDGWEYEEITIPITVYRTNYGFHEEPDWTQKGYHRYYMDVDDNMIQTISDYLEVSPEFFTHNIGTYITYTAAQGTNYDYNMNVTAYENEYAIGHWWDHNCDVPVEWTYSIDGVYAQLRIDNEDYSLKFDVGCNPSVTNPGEYFPKTAFVNQPAKRAYVIKWDITVLPGEPKTPRSLAITPNRNVGTTVGKTVNLTATLTDTDNHQSNVTNDSKTVWTSSDEHIATVENGVVTGKHKGTVIITATYTENGVTVTASQEVTIGLRKPVNIKISTTLPSHFGSTTIKVGESSQLVATVIFDNNTQEVVTTNENTTWTSNKPNEVSVGAHTGIVTGISNDFGVSYINITVSYTENGVTVTSGNLRMRVGTFY